GGTLLAKALSKVLNRVQDDICPISRIAYFAICTKRKKASAEINSGLLGCQLSLVLLIFIHHFCVL
ncbi:hypothetical protein, partial [Vibrio breoganii]|uniref:hypothetical protein n=1 Tax=Vibrio breoganii TaxID=553239 RepID=UPI001A7E1818